MTRLSDPEIQAFVDREVAAGTYDSEEALLQEAVKLLRAASEARDALIADLQRGQDDLVAGRSRPLGKGDAAALIEDILAR